jgi:dienelactone hydrolase
MSLHTLTDEARTGTAREVVRLDAREDGSARALVTAPPLLGIADHRYATGWWRDLRIDESVSGLAAERPQPTAVVIEHRGNRWPLAVRGLLGCALAWNPLRPLVAGLAVGRGHAHPWVADYHARTVKMFERVRAGTSLTGLDRGGSSPLCWLDEHRLAFLAPPPRRVGPPLEEPLIYDGCGPGFVSFEPGLDELLAAAGAAISSLDVGDGTVAELTRPLLVRRMRRAAGCLLVGHATRLREDAQRSGSGRDGLVWSDGRLDLSSRVPTLRACEDGALRDTARPRRPAPVRAARPGPRLATSTRMLAPPAAGHPARLAVFSRPDTGRPAATLLWIRASRGPLDPSEPVPAPLPDAGTAAATLDLPVHWPADATAGMLQDQIVGAVQAAADALDTDRIVVGGHSFGATLALLALAHVPGLAAGIAHSGCYNRTHTPFGFHYERRSYWDAREVYDTFSALSFADRIRRPVLIAHGLEDANPATHPDQAAELYRGIVATGGTARLVLLPREEHSFRYRETHRRLALLHRDWLQRAATTRWDAGGDPPYDAAASDAR